MDDWYAPTIEYSEGGGKHLAAPLAEGRGTMRTLVGLFCLPPQWVLTSWMEPWELAGATEAAVGLRWLVLGCCQCDSICRKGTTRMAVAIFRPRLGCCGASELAGRRASGTANVEHKQSRGPIFTSCDFILPCAPRQWPFSSISRGVRTPVYQNTVRKFNHDADEGIEYDEPEWWRTQR